MTKRADEIRYKLAVPRPAKVDAEGSESVFYVRMSIADYEMSSEMRMAVSDTFFEMD